MQLHVRTRFGELFQVKPGTEIITTETNGEWNLQFISALSGRMIRLSMMEVERIFLQ